MKKILGLFFTMILAVTLFACGGETTTASTTAGTGTTTATTTTVSTEAPKVMVVGYDPFSGKFSPFFSDTAYDADVVGMTQVGLLTTDRDGGIVYNAIDGETVPRGGVDYFYNGVADIAVNYDETAGETTYSIEIRDDIQFSDGEYLTADDIIFTYYVLLDPYYTGSSTLSSVDIVGLKNYKFNDSNAEAAQAASAAAAATLLENLDTVDEDADFAQLVKDEIYSLLDSEWDWVEADVVTNDAYIAAGYVMKEDGTEATNQEEASVAATLAFFYALDTYSVVDKDRETVVQDIADMYGVDYELLDSYYGASVVAPIVETLAVEYAIADYLETNPGDPVPNVSGITRVSDTEVTVVVNGFDAAAVYQVCGISVAPVHYYGDDDLVDYANNEFGFNNRTETSMEMIQSKTSAPMGAGPYKFVEYDNNVVRFEANPYYFKGEPLTKYVNFQVVTEDGKISGIVAGDIDVSNPSGSRVKFQEIDTINKYSGEDYDVITVSSIDNLGYGYFGINAFNVNVNDIPDSAASKALRTGFAVVVAATRHTSINSYYGEAASIINYPISNTSWAAPKEGEVGYEIAFSEKPDGTDIYTADPATLPESERLAAAKAGAKLWFEEAGYVFTDTGNAGDFGGNIYTAVAPIGAKLTYEVIVPGGGTGDHPSYMIAVEMSNILEELGFTIEINDPANSNVLWDALDTVTQEMWVAAWGSTIDPDMYQVYHSNNVPVIAGGAANSTESNHYGIQDDTLDEKIMEARTSDDQAFRKATYKECLDIILDWAVEIPTYQRQNIIAFSTERVNMDTVTPGITTYYGWMAEVENIEMN
ncbi:MAG: ABC transporter substrate-binding protein [Bacilli bacterium]|nr:ABC transporter substrate-binding protein [Bacilli bacterium]MBN2696146.1 ABC transporter substrate-binding protein [Bacilli bacterium]